MSDIEVKIVKLNVFPHPGADRLEIGRVGDEGGYECVIGLSQFQDQDLAIFVPPGSVVPEKIQKYLEQNKITIKNGRIRAIKIRGVLSEGLCLKPGDWLEETEIVEDKDVTKTLGVIKYEPPINGGAFAIFKKGKGVSTRYTNDRFLKYDCITHFKKYPSVLKEGEDVVITTKFHGTNSRIGLVDKPANTLGWWQKLWDRLLKKQRKEFLVGSHNTIRMPGKDTDVDSDLYLRAAAKYQLKSITKQISQGHITANGRLPDVIIYSEVVGPKIQSGYCYGVKEGEIGIRIFDIMIDKKFLNWESTKHLCDCFNLPIVDEVYVGPWHLDLLKHAEAVDKYNGKKYVREGIVIKPLEERRAKCGRVALKYLSEKYLLDSKNTDYH